MSKFDYLSGFGSHVATESLPGTLPKGQNSPQVCSYGLYAEQLSGTAFTVPRCKNLRSWLYRIRPSVVHQAFEGPLAHPGDVTSAINEKYIVHPMQCRWDPPDLEDSVYGTDSEVDFVEGLRAVCGAGDCSLKEGICIYNYVCNKDMRSSDGKGADNRAFINADGDLLIVPQQGVLVVFTELGRLSVEPEEICVIPRGIKFCVNLSLSDGEQFARGYMCELFKGHYELPNLGPIGANGLANPRDFLCPTAYYEDIDEDVTYTLLHKFQGTFFSCELGHSPFDVVGWHGNYYPFKYDLRTFNAMNTVSFDHADPSIFTVLTAPTEEPGVAAVDFVIFPPRWMVAKDTFRPPFFHRNCMSEYMGMIYGTYKGKEGGGFEPGGSSLHSCMTAHGPDAITFEKASAAKLEPVYFDGGLAFMFESTYLFKLAPKALSTKKLQTDYSDCWQGMKKNFRVPSSSLA